MKTCIMGLALSAGLLCAAVSEAKDNTTGSAGTATRARKAKAPKVPVKLDNGETRKERDQRLLRECRGRPNAGACEGYAN